MRSAADQTSDEAGFRDGTSSVHTSRTMMLRELDVLLGKVSPAAPPVAYREAVVVENVLGKPTRSTRERTAQRLAELYLLDPAVHPFRVFRDGWAAEIKARPMLALLLACWRDPLLRQATPFVLAVPVGRPVTAPQVAAHLAEAHPQRFGKTTLVSTAQNLASSWTQAGYLRGKARKVRDRPAVTPLAAAFALFLAYLRGARGELLLDSAWARLLDRPRNDVADLAAEASRQGWLRLKAAGSVTEITFSNWPEASTALASSSTAASQEVA